MMTNSSLFHKSVLQQAREAYQPKLPSALWGPVKAVRGEATESIGDQEEIKKLFPNTYGLPELRFENDVEAAKSKDIVGDKFNVGVILSGGQAPGGHNVISGLFDGIKSINKENRLYGFLMGPSGLVDHDYIELTSDLIDQYRNTGGFDIIGSGRTKLETPEQFDKGLEIIKELNIRAIVIVGGDDSNTNAAILAEYYKAKNEPVQVIGCPKTIDGDLKNAWIETSFGFDTATKLYSELIGNVERDAHSSKKYWHFIKLMGRSASHIALECALKTQPNYCIISEEVAANNKTLKHIVEDIANVVAKRAADGKNFGTILIPEGLIEFLPSIKKLIAELNDLLANHSEVKGMDEDQLHQFVINHLSQENADTFASLPKDMALQLALDRDPHGNVQVSLVETEKLLSDMVGERLEKMKAEGKYVGKYAALHHFFGYEGRCADPSNFDSDYCYSLGFNAAQLINIGATGYMSLIRNLSKSSVQWIAGGIPITMMFNMERRNGEVKPVIRKALVDLEGRPFQVFAENRNEWARETCYLYPGPVQYFGPDEICNQTSRTLYYEQEESK